KRFESGDHTSAWPNASAVSRQRHHGLESTRLRGIARAWNTEPTRLASARPASVRLCWVAQSSRRKPAGSPTPGVVTRVAHEDDLTAAAQQLPDGGVVGGRGRRLDQDEQDRDEPTHSRTRSDVEC